MNAPLPLAKLPVGRPAAVVLLSGPPQAQQRLAEAGFLEGVTVEVRGVAPLGDPIELELHGYLVSLRLADAALVTVLPHGDSA